MLVDTGAGNVVFDANPPPRLKDAKVSPPAFAARVEGGDDTG